MTTTTPDVTPTPYNTTTDHHEEHATMSDTTERDDRKAALIAASESDGAPTGRVVRCGICSTWVAQVREPHVSYWVAADGDSLSYGPSLHDHAPGSDHPREWHA